MAYLLTLVYGPEASDLVNSNQCPICFPLSGRMYPPGSERELPLHAGCSCLYNAINLGDPDSEQDHIHQDLIDDIHHLDITELQQQLLDFAAILQDLIDRVCVNIYA